MRPNSDGVDWNFASAVRRVQKVLQTRCQHRRKNWQPSVIDHSSADHIAQVRPRQIDHATKASDPLAPVRRGEGQGEGFLGFFI